jgi:cyclic-di-GMP phosphodiesterase, flagellum assembly factor TipF
VKVITGNRIIAPLAAALASVSVVVIGYLAYTSASPWVLGLSALVAAWVILIAWVLVLQSRKIAQSEASNIATKTHMATLARYIREGGERAEPVIETKRAVPEIDFSAITGAVSEKYVSAQADIEALGRIVAELADAVTSHEERIGLQEQRIETLVEAAGQQEISPQRKRSIEIANSMIGLRTGESEITVAKAPSPPAEAPTQSPPQPSRPAPVDPVLANRVKSAFQNNRVDLFMRPVVTLPHRKTRYYEATIGIEHNGATLSGAALGLVARRIGVSRQRDVAVLARLIRLARYFRSKNRDVPLFAELSDQATLSDRVFANLVEAMSAEASIARLIMIAMPQAVITALRPVEIEVLRAFREAGGRLVATGFADLSVRPEALAAASVKIVQTPAGVLMSAIEAGVAIQDLHPQDLPGLFLRRGIEMIIDDIDGEQRLADLAEAGLTLGEGPLFGDWRLVREDLLDAAPPAAAAMQDSAPAADGTATPTSGEGVAAEQPQRVPFRSLLRRA